MTTAEHEATNRCTEPDHQFWTPSPSWMEKP